MLVNIYMKTHENILNILKLNIGHDLVTKTATFKVQRDITKKYRLCARVMAPAFCKSPYCA